MFSEFIKRILDNERESLSNRQEHTMPDVIAHKSSITKTDKYQSDIEALKQKYGERFITGLCIEITLKEMLEIAPRLRARIDAYRGLISYLKDSYGIILTIKSQKTK